MEWGGMGRGGWQEHGDGVGDAHTHAHSDDHDDHDDDDHYDHETGRAGSFVAGWVRLGGGF